MLLRGGRSQIEKRSWNTRFALPLWQKHCRRPTAQKSGYGGFDATPAASVCLRLPSKERDSICSASVENLYQTLSGLVPAHLPEAISPKPAHQHPRGGHFYCGPPDLLQGELINNGRDQPGNHVYALIH